MEAKPTKIELASDGSLRIVWNDGQQRLYAIAELREQCPCASCRERRSQPSPPPTQLEVISSAETQPLTIQGMEPAGSYAYSISFSDGHATGIYTLELLRKLGHKAEGGR